MPKLTDAQALDEMARLFRRPEWPGACFPEWLAEIVANTGRDIVNGEHDAYCECGRCMAIEEIAEIEADIEEISGVLAETNDPDEVAWMAHDLADLRERLAARQKEVGE